MLSADRFLLAQAPVIEAVLAELRAGHKQTHWMWFIFPQLKDLGRSATARYYGLEGVDDARAWLVHPVLGPRLLACTQAVLGHADVLVRDIMGSPDDLKLHSCMTLFQVADPAQPLFEQVLQAFYNGRPDDLTLDLLRQSPASLVE
jgi:uncharacterized protein (DUF1810 family)